MDLYEDLFAYVCELHRLARKQAHFDATVVAGTLRTKIDGAHALAKKDTQTLANWDSLLKPLYCFLDYMIESTSSAELAGRWVNHRLARTVGITFGDKDFFNVYLDPDLKRAPSSPQRLDGALRAKLLFYQRCLLVGFQGMFHIDPVKNDERKNVYNLQQLNQRKAELHRLLTPQGGASPIAPRFTPAAYNACGRTLELNSAPAFWGMVAVLVIFVVLFLGVTNWMYQRASDRLEKAVIALEESGKLH